MSGGMVGISPDEANHLFNQQGAQTDIMRNAIGVVGNHVESLASSTHVSATTATSRARWDSEVRPQLESLCNESDEKREGGQKCVAQQQANQDHGAAAVTSI
ncbi:MAG: hypothetical protein WAV90_16480 [Gordonia amarae]